MTIFELALPLLGLMVGIAVGHRHGFWGGVVDGLAGAGGGFAVYFLLILFGFLMATAMEAWDKKWGKPRKRPEPPDSVWPPPPRIP